MRWQEPRFADPGLPSRGPGGAWRISGAPRWRNAWCQCPAAVPASAWNVPVGLKLLARILHMLTHDRPKKV